MNWKSVARWFVFGLVTILWSTPATAGILVGAGDLTGSRSTPTSSGVIAADGWTDANGGFLIQWEIFFDGLVWNYTYTITDKDGSEIAPELSHALLEVSDFIDADNVDAIIFGANGTVLGPQLHTADPDYPNNTTPGGNGGDPNLKGDVYAIKFDFGGDTYTLQSTQAPMWGDFYIKDGKQAGIVATAQNGGIGTDPTALTVDFTPWIPVPDTLVGPTPTAAPTASPAPTSTPAPTATSTPAPTPSGTPLLPPSPTPEPVACLLDVEKGAAPIVVGGSGDVTYTFSVTNTSGNGHDATLTGLVDSVYGDLDGQGDCSVPQTIADGATYSCSIVEMVSGLVGEQIVNVVMADAEDSISSLPCSGDATATVTIVDEINPACRHSCPARVKYLQTLGRSTRPDFFRMNGSLDLPPDFAPSLHDFDLVLSNTSGVIFSWKISAGDLEGRGSKFSFKDKPAKKLGGVGLFRVWPYSVLDSWRYKIKAFGDQPSLTFRLDRFSGGGSEVSNSRGNAIGSRSG